MYGHDEAVRDLERMRVYGLSARCTTPDDEHARLTAYIERLELAYTNCRDCETFTANATLRAERDEALRELAEA